MEANRPLTADEEALKKNTDCIYFLASPFTCKKGNECEFRHSEGARVNPRDCWYWMNGNCLNPKCAFRHPPLDGLFGIPGAPSGPLPSSLHVPVHASGAYNPSKQSIPCYYFQKGQCIKGDKCPFMHGPQPASNHSAEQVTNGPPSAANNDPLQLTTGSHPAANHVLQQAPSIPTSFSGTAQMVSWSLKECSTSQHTIPKDNEKRVEVLHSSAKSANNSEGPPVKSLPLRRSPSPYPLNYELPRSQPTVASISSDVSPSRPHQNQPQPTEDHYSNGRETDDFLGESSPGFDVLVDDEEDYGRNPEYYVNEDEYVRNMNQSVNDFDYPHPDFEAVANFEREQYNRRGEYDQYGREHGQYDREHFRASAERPMDKIPKRRLIHRDLSPDEIDGSDLRHRLLKQRRLNGLRSAVSPDRHGEPHRRDDRHAEDRYRGRPSGRDWDRRHVPLESSLSSRLQGRITLPVRSSPDRPIELRSDRDRDRHRHSDRERRRGRLSPARPINYKGRLQDRIRRSPDDEFTSGRRRFGGLSNRRDDGDSSKFSGPRSSVELKVAKVWPSSQDQPTKGLNVPLSAGFQAPEGSLSFEGPKPLSEILKRKRESASGNVSVPSSGDESNGRNPEGLVDSASAAAALKSDYDFSGVDKSDVQTVEEEEEGLLPGEGDVGQLSARDDTPEEGDAAAADATEDQGLENFDPKEGDYDDEAIQGEEGQNAYQDDENMYQDDENAYHDDEDDEDDFAKKVGVFFS